MNPDLAGAITYSVRLREILDEEFELLSNNQIDAFENLQLIKGELLALLSAVVQHAADCKPKAADLAPDWQIFCDQMQMCREAHLRNEILIRSRLDAILGTLRILQNSADMDSACQIYDRMGRISDRFGGKHYADA
jgi:flagellar biosynthesis/type III secretory pathway chaperone